MASSAPSLHSSSPQINTGESFHNLEVMSPSAMAFLLEVISADISKAEDAERCQRNSQARDEHPSGARPSGPPGSPKDDQSLSVSDASALTDLQPAISHNSLITDTTQTLATTISTLVDVTNNQQQPTLSAHDSNTSKPHQSPPRKRKTSQRKRTIDEDEEDEDGVLLQRLKKKSRSSTSEGNSSQQHVRRRSSTCSDISQSELSTAVVPPTLKATDDTNTTGADDEKGTAKKSRSRRFKEDELAFLDAVFKTEPYPDPMVTERLSIQLEVSEHRIKVWFANRRHRQARDREQKTSNTTEKKDRLVTETAAVPAESSKASSALPNSPSFTPHYGMVPSGYSYVHPSTIPSAIPKHTPAMSAEGCARAQIASTIQSRFPFSSPALLQLANQTMLARSGMNQCHSLTYPMSSGSVSSGDICDLARMPRRRPSCSYYVEPPILPPLTAESTSYTDGVSLSPAIDDSPSPWHWMP